MQSKARIIFAGSPEFALPPLQKLLASKHELVAVLTQPDRPAGRGRRLQAGPIKEAAIAAGIPVRQPSTLRDHEVQQTLRALRPDLMVVVAYGLLLPPEVLAIPHRGCVNVHASLLPRWRGAAPIQMAVLSGDSETGISLMQMDEGLDTGAVFARVSTPIGQHETAGQLHDRLAPMGGELLAANLDAILAGQLHPEPQSNAGITYAGRINKADGVIDWSQSATVIDRIVRGYNPWPVAQTTLHGNPLRCWSAVVAEHSSTVLPGTVLETNAAGIIVQTGAFALTLTEVQAPGRKRISAAEFAHAQPLDGVVLGC